MAMKLGVIRGAEYVARTGEKRCLHKHLLGKRKWKILNRNYVTNVK
jgi:hypothetical protein